MKKLLILILAIALIFALAACNEEDMPETTQPEETPAEEPYEDETPAEEEQEDNEETVIQIASVEDMPLTSFSNYHEVDYSQIRGDGVSGTRLVIWANTPIRNISLLSVVADIVEDEWIYIPTGTYGTVSELLPGEAFVINAYIGLGTLPGSGITFTDTDGEQRYFVMIENMGYPEAGDRWLIWEFENKGHELPEVEEEYEDGNGENINENDTRPGYVHGDPLGLTIVQLVDDGPGPGALADVTFMHMLNYSELSNWDGGHGHTLMIQTYTPLRDFAVISIVENLAVDDVITFIPMETFGTVANFLPGEAFIINDYIWMGGALPMSGITFLDESGQRWFFTIFQNQAYPEHGAAYQLREFPLRAETLPSDWVAPW